MRYLSAAELLTEEIHLHDLCAFPVREPLGHEGVFTNKKRRCSVLFLYLSGQREYTAGSGNRFFLNPGDILYVPQHATYRFRITDTQDAPLDHAIAVNFKMTDAAGEVVCFGAEPHIVLHQALSAYLLRFQRIAAIDNSTKRNTMLFRSAVYALCHDIFSELHASSTTAESWSIILPAIKAIESAPAEDVPIPELARQCGVSETYFRQLFKQYTGGESAVRYRNRLRIEQAIRMLRTEQVTVEYAARAAGFRDMSHFYRLYKTYQTEQK